MLDWDGDKPPHYVFSEISQISSQHAHSICQKNFAPDIVYSSLLEWIKIR